MILASILSELYETIIEPIVNALRAPFEAIVEALEAFGKYLVSGSIEAWNAFMFAIEEALTFFLAHLPEIERPHFSEIPGFETAVKGINALFPIGPYITYLVSLLTAAGLFIVIRYVLRLVKFL